MLITPYTIKKTISKVQAPGRVSYVGAWCGCCGCATWDDGWNDDALHTLMNFSRKDPPDIDLIRTSHSRLPIIARR